MLSFRNIVCPLLSSATLLFYQFHKLRALFICRFPSCCGLRCTQQICTHLLLLQKWLVSCLVPNFMQRLVIVLIMREAANMWFSLKEPDM